MTGRLRSVVFQSHGDRVYEAGKSVRAVVSRRIRARGGCSVLDAGVLAMPRLRQNASSTALCGRSARGRSVERPLDARDQVRRPAGERELIHVPASPTPRHFGFGFKLKLMALQAQRNESGLLRGVTNSQDSHLPQLKHPSRSLNEPTTGSKSFLPKLAHSL